MTVVESCSTSWDRLHDILLHIKPGDTITPEQLVTQTGLSPEMVRTVLEALTRAELFQKSDAGAFVRRSLWGPPVS